MCTVQMRRTATHDYIDMLTMPRVSFRASGGTSHGSNGSGTEPDGSPRHGSPRSITAVWRASPSPSPSPSTALLFRTFTVTLTLTFSLSLLYCDAPHSCKATWYAQSSP